MTCLLDDASPLVRRALAEALAGAAEAPHHLVSALVNDQADIAALVLARSPRLSDAELIDAAALGEAPAQCAIAARPGLSAAVAGGPGRGRHRRSRAGAVPQPGRRAGRRLDPSHPGALRPRRRGARSARRPARPRRRAAPRPRGRHRGSVARLRHLLRLDGAGARPPRRRRRERPRGSAPRGIGPGGGSPPRPSPLRRSPAPHRPPHAGPRHPRAAERAGGVVRGGAGGAVRAAAEPRVRPRAPARRPRLRGAGLLGRAFGRSAADPARRARRPAPRRGRGPCPAASRRGWRACWPAAASIATLPWPA